MFVVSIPSGEDETATYSTLRQKVSNYAEVSKFRIPTFKIGTLDGLVQHSEELAKLDNAFDSTVIKIADVLKSLFDGNEERLQQYKLINEKPVEAYARSFQWNTTKYRTDRQLTEIIESLNAEVSSLDSDVRNKYSQYSAAKTNLLQLQRKTTGNLSQKSLVGIVSKENIISDSEYLTTLFIAVPNSSVKEWRNAYETLTPMVVPRSSVLLASDSEFHLFSVVVFQKYAQEFLHKARERRFAPREFTWTEQLASDSEKEIGDAEASEKKLYGESLRLTRTAFSDAAQGLFHLKALRVFVESVLRYGLPPEFVSAIVFPYTKQAKKAKAIMDTAYNYLGGKESQKKVDLGEFSTLVGEGGEEGYVIYALEI